MPEALIKMLDDYDSKGTTARFLVSFVVSCIYGFVLSIFGGTIIWASIGHGLADATAIAIVVAFFGLEFVLMSFKDLSPGILITALILIPCAHARGLKWSQAPSEVRKSLNDSTKLVRASARGHAH